MKPTFTYTIGVDLPRSIFSRESIKEMDKRYKKNPDMKDYYTGLAGRRMCFAFPDEETKIKFMEIFSDIFSNIQKKN